MPEQDEDRVPSRIVADLDRLQEHSQLRSLEVSSGVNLSSNDYLGLAVDPRLKQAAVDSVSRAERVGATGSRLLSGHAREWDSLEEEFARFAGTEAALYFGCGYAANVGLLSSVLKHGDAVFSDALNHASLIDGIRLSAAQKVKYPHGDLEYLEAALRRHSGGSGARVIVTESIFSMEGDVAPIEQLLRLARDHKAALIVDEAHATGVRGPQGSGVVAELGLQKEVLAIVHTCGKSLASAGGLACGSAALKKYLINRARTFIFSTAMPPYMAGQIRAALELAMAADAERAHLQKISDALRAKLRFAGLNL